MSALRAEAGEVGPFGPVFRDIENDPEAAIARLMREKQGEVPAAFTHPDAPDEPIGFVYGNSKMGLRHIAEKHPDQFARLPEILRSGRLVDDPDGLPRRYIVADGDPAEVAVVRLDWDGIEKHWLVTTYPADYGRFARRQKEANRSGSSEARVPASTGHPQDGIRTGANQADEVADALAKARAASDVQQKMVDMGDGKGERSLQSILDELDADEEAANIIALCGRMA